MNLPAKYRAIALSITFILIIIWMVCLAMVRNFALTTEITANMNIYYILISISVLLVISMFLLIMRLTGSGIQNYYITNYFNQKKQVVEEQQDEEREEIQEKEEETQEELDRNIFPHKKFKYLDSYAEKLLINMGKYLQISQGMFYMLDHKTGKYKIAAKYATTVHEGNEEVEAGVGLTGQVVLDKKMNVMDQVPDDYISIESGLGKGQPAQLIIIPAMKDGEVIAILELASLKKIEEKILALLAESIYKLGDQLDNYELR